MDERDNGFFLARVHQLRCLDREADKKNITLSEWDVNGIRIAVGMLIDEMAQELREIWMNSHGVFDKVRENFENETLEHGKRQKHNISECIDWRDEYISVAFCEEFWYNPFDNHKNQLTKLEKIIDELTI
jgi:hypothetical protein